MPKTMTATDAKVRLGAMIDWTVEEGDELIIESRGKPKAVLMSYAEFEKVQRLRETARRQEALRQLQALAERVSERNKDLNQESADALADRFVRDVIDDLTAEGMIRFEEM